ncbi:chondroitin proteoglycan 2-like [Amphibalanus amphitrite]|uniref:chondroitin proteoglycan 2-like n=1 Tax=Amphibalanus amphitrite TaxID=1232801 RepID=UPI001C928893|nr:chondroitin proteoglycan 2-like [Amphibalanus amphitrite]
MRWLVPLRAVCLTALVCCALSAPTAPCPATSPDQQVFVTSNSSCAEFYLCSNGVPHLLVCPGDLYFNPATRRCDYRHNVPCDLAAPPAAAVSAPAGQRAHHPAVSSAPVCPDPPGRYPALFPNPDSCSTYYMCAGTTAVLMPCPEGLLFNNDTWTCDFPSNVVCPELYAAAAARSGSLSAAASVSKGTPPPSDKCPSVDGTYPVLLPNPDDCGSFYMCSHGAAYLVICMPGLWFNNNTWTCDYPQNVQCNPSGTSAATGVKALLSVRQQMEVANDCPAVDGTYPTLLPNPANCSTFYMCSHGVPYLYTCPAGLHFNKYTSTCDYPWRARCTETEGTKALKRGAPTAKDPSAALTCPSVDGKYPTFLPNPYDCTSYYMCSHGVAYLYYCPAGLHFNRYINTCDYPYRAQCTEIDDKTSVKTGALSGAGALASAGSASTCPAVDGKYPTFLPNPYDCTTFYMCSHGVPYLFHCPAGLEFNKYSNTCVSPLQSQCTEIEGKKSMKSVAAPNPGNVMAVSEPAGTCPERDGANPVFLPNPQDCSTFYLCSNGVPYLQHCPEGLEFNSRTNTCDFSWHAGCQEINGTAAAQPALSP